MGRRLLVTGGSGYFGTMLAAEALDAGDEVRVLDLHRPTSTDVDFVQADVRDFPAVARACRDVDVVLHNVAQVPLANDKELFWSVNVGGTANVLLAAREAGVGKVVHTSSSAIFGIPEHNPVTEATPPRPLEAYGRAKLAAEAVIADAVSGGLDVTIIRPRTILGHGRLGIMAVLFEFVREGAPLFTLGDGGNRYQFVHARDLANACLLAAARPGSDVYNVGAAEFGTMRESLSALVEHAGTGSTVRSLPVVPARVAMRALSRIGLAPFAPYHWLLYSESLWFDSSKAQRELGWSPRYSNADMLIESYEWFLANGAGAVGGDRSHHQSAVRLGALRLLKRLG